MRLTATLLVAAGWLGACGEPLREAARDAAPAYAAVSLDGAPVSLDDLRGDAVLLNVWATWCGPCREEIPFLAKVHQAEVGNGLRVVGVSIDNAADRDTVADGASQLGITYEVWLDPEERIAGVMRYAGVPASMLIDREGVMRWKHVGVLRATTPGFEEALRDVLAVEPTH